MYTRYTSIYIIYTPNTPLNTPHIHPPKLPTYRSKQEIFILGGHDGTVNAVACQASDPQIITGSADTTIRLWDLAAGKSSAVLTNHKKVCK